jgi:hypothetical protein
MIKGKSPEEIRKTFNIKNDFTPAEEEQVSKKEMCAVFSFVRHLTQNSTKRFKKCFPSKT